VTKGTIQRSLSARSFSILKTSTISSIRSYDDDGTEESVSSIICDFGQKLVHFF